MFNIINVNFNFIILRMYDKIDFYNDIINLTLTYSRCNKYLIMLLSAFGYCVQEQ